MVCVANMQQAQSTDSARIQADRVFTEASNVCLSLHLSVVLANISQGFWLHKYADLANISALIVVNCRLTVFCRNLA